MSDDEGLHPNDQSEPEQPVEPVRNSVPKKVSTELVEIALISSTSAALHLWIGAVRSTSTPCPSPTTT